MNYCITPTWMSFVLHLNVSLHIQLCKCKGRRFVLFGSLFEAGALWPVWLVQSYHLASIEKSRRCRLWAAASLASKLVLAKNKRYENIRSSHWTRARPFAEAPFLLFLSRSPFGNLQFDELFPLLNSFCQGTPLAVVALQILGSCSSTTGIRRSHSFNYISWGLFSVQISRINHIYITRRYKEDRIGGPCGLFSVLCLFHFIPVFN